MSDIVSRGGLADALGMIWGSTYRGYTIGFNLQVPLGNKPEQADYARAVTDKKGAETRRASLMQQIAREVRSADSQVKMGSAQIVAAEKAHELAFHALRAEEKKFNIGAANSEIHFVLEAQRNLATAETNEMRSLINYQKALAAYDRAVGRTLKQQNIEIAKEMSVSPTSVKRDLLTLQK